MVDIYFADDLEDEIEPLTEVLRQRILYWFEPDALWPRSRELMRWEDDGGR